LKEIHGTGFLCQFLPEGDVMKAEKRTRFAKNPGKFIGKAIVRFVQKSPANRQVTGQRTTSIDFVGRG